MALEILKCPNCGAPMPREVVGGVVVCPYCNRSVVATGVAGAPPAQPPAAQPPPPAKAPAAPPAQAAAQPAAPPAKAPAAKPPAHSGVEPVMKPAAKTAAEGKVRRTAVAKADDAQETQRSSRVRVESSGRRSGVVNPGALWGGGGREADAEEEAGEDEETFEWTEENVTAFARESLGTHDSLYFSPKIPRDKEKAARETHKESLERDERVLVLYDDTVFGGADDGFVVTTERFCWKNFALDPHARRWEEIDPDGVEWTDESLKVDGEEIQITNGSSAELYAALGGFIQEMASMAQDFEEEEDE